MLGILSDVSILFHCTPLSVLISTFNLLKTGPKYTLDWGLWEMSVIAKSKCFRQE